MSTNPGVGDEVPTDDRMTAAELRVTREYLGLTGDALAEHLGVASRTVRHWEAGVYTVPDGVRQETKQLEAITAQAVTDGVAQLMDEPDPTVLTYRTDAEYHDAHPEITLPASWHRAVVARIAQEVPGLAIDYAPPIDIGRGPERIAAARARVGEMFPGSRVVVERRHCHTCQQIHSIAVAYRDEVGEPTTAQYYLCTRTLDITQGNVVPNE